MKKRLLAGILSLVIALSLLPTAALAEGSQAIAVYYSRSEDVIKEFSTVQEISDYSKTIFTQGGTLRFFSDVEMEPWTEGEEGVYVGLLCGEITIDLNGHTLTFSMPEGANESATAIWGIVCSKGAVRAQNGTIIMDCSATDAMDDSIQTSDLLGAYAFVQMSNSGESVFENVVIVTTEDNSLTSAVYSAPEGAGNSNLTVTMSNCTIDVGEGTAVYNHAQLTNSVVIQSGSYKNLDSDDEHIQIQEGSECVNVPDVTATVITSSDTTAIIVDNGNAYLYDSLQDAVNAASAKATSGGDGEQDVTIHLVKQPQGATIIPDDAPGIILTALNDSDSIEIDKIALETTDGTAITPDGEGKVEIVAVEDVTISGETSVETGKTIQLAATVIPDNATDKTVTWSSSDTGIAAVDENGTVTGVATGTATITATAGGKSATHTVTVTAQPATPDPEPSDPGSSSGGSTSVRRYNIEADAGRGGEISPDGRVRVRRGENQTFRITADDGWEIADVEVDGESVGAVERYTFENVRTDHTISATFRQIVTEPEEPETPALPFTDVSEGDWYYDAVAFCWENGIMDGTSGTVFAPNLLLNRAMMAQVLYNLAGGTASTAAGFPDVAASAWYADAVNWAAANGYVTGYDNGSYGPEDSLTREQLAVILYRYAGSPAPAGSLDGFADAASASAYAVDALRWAVGEGLLTGKDGGRLDPTGTASRAELAQILARFAG